MSTRWGVLLPVFFLLSCFGIDQRGGIVKYSDGAAYTGTGRFTVGKLPSPWKGPKIRLKQLVYENDEIGGTIVADALCGAKFQDAPLSRLATDLFFNLTDKELGTERSFTLGGRSAIRLEGSGSLDGVPIRMEVAVMKKDFCLYDFVYFAPPNSFLRGIKDYEGFLYGFKTR